MHAVSRYRGRFAPSPTGLLHPGSLLTAFASWLFARRAQGEWWVRIEDLDPPREIAGAADEQLRTLEAFGLVPDAPVARQGARHAAYAVALERLLRDGHAFTCQCSRADLVGEGGIHRACVPGATRPDPAIRMRVPARLRIAFDDALQGRIEQDLERDVGDFVLRRSDGLWAYQLAVVVDDAAQGMTHVVRGADLLDSTARQILLQRRLGLPTPHYTHLPLLVDDDGHKLSKSAAAMPVDTSDPLPALRACWRALGQDPTRLAALGDLESLLHAATGAFDPGRIPRRRTLPLAALHNGQMHGPV